MKKLLIALGVLVLLVVVAVVIIASQAGALIKRGVETYGPELTGTPVTVSNVDVSLLSGHASLRNLMIGNPAGFSASEAFKVGQVEVQLDIASLFSEQVRIQKILVDGAELTYELTQKGSNIDALRKNVERNTASSGSKSAETSQETGGGVQLMIDDLYINGTRANLLAPTLGQEQRSVTVPDIHLQALGQGGATIEAITRQVMRRVTQVASEAAMKELGERKVKEAIEQKKGEALEKLDEKLKGLF